MDTKMLSVIVFISIFMFLGLSLVYLYLYNQYREKYMFIWGIGWLLASLRIVLDLVRFNVFDSTLLLVVNQLFTISAAMFLVWGMYAFMGKRLPRFWVISGIAVTLFADVILILGLSFHLATVPTASYLLVAHLWLGGKFLSFRGSKGSGKWNHLYGNV